MTNQLNTPINQKRSTSFDHHPFSKIKDIYIELCRCEFHHSYLSGEEDDIFIGRGKAKRRLKMILEHSSSQSGAYLVTGFRGMGKTSLVYKALDEHNKDKNTRNKVEKIPISLSQDEISEIDVLRQMARQLTYKWEDLGLDSTWRRLYLISRAILLPFFICGLAYLIILCFKSPGFSIKDIFRCLVPFGLILVGCLVIVITQLRFRLIKVSKKPVYWRITRRLQFLNQRLDAQIEREKGSSFQPEIEINGLSKIKAFNRLSRVSEVYSLASSKEIEKELIRVLNEINEYRKRYLNRKGDKRKWPFLYLKQVPQFIFIVDELDKVQPDLFNADPEKAGSNTLALAQQRHESVGRLLANLKSFLNEAKAKFIFIGGRDMYDASLADIADRESFYSSIFHDVIYVNSFFKDKLFYRSGVSRMTEAYVCKMIIPQEFAEQEFKEMKKGSLNKPQEEHITEVYSLNTLYKYFIKLHNSNSGAIPSGWAAKLRVYKIIYLLQNFIVYLNYRTNGTPKKLTSLIEQFVIPDIMVPNQQSGNAFCETDSAVVLHTHNGSNQHRKHLYLKFNFNQQYEIGLTSNLYRPYVIIHSRYLKSLGDKMLYSTAFIMDYILKFHPHGFSWRNLEMIPDVILTNKDPNLRYFMRDLMSFLTLMHVRETVNGMFRYKFYSKIANEIRYLSRISELGSAAFNFTLDESQQIKFLYKEKLRELEQRHQSPTVQIHSNDKASESKGFVYSVQFIQDILGDLHYFDKEYDEAIIYYSDALQPLRQTDPSYHQLSIDQTVIYTRGLLKLCMALEKIQQYDQAYANYRNLIEELSSLLTYYTLTQESSGKKHKKPADEDRPLRRMQLFLRPYIAILDLIEKQRLDGITFANLRRNVVDLNTLFDPERETPFTPMIKGQKAGKSDPKDIIRLNTLYSDYFSHVGGILYYKNTNFKGVFDGFKKLMPDKYKNKDLQFFLKEQRMRKKGEPEKDQDFDYNPPMTAYLYYLQAISEFIRSFHTDLEEIIGSAVLKETLFVQATRLLHPKANQLANTMHFYTLGNLFGKLGDTVLASCGHKYQQIDSETLYLYFLPDTADKYMQCIKQCKSRLDNAKFPFHNNLDSALVLFRLAGLFYLRANRSYSYGLQLKKFLFVFKDWLESNKNMRKKQVKELKKLEQSLREKIEHEFNLGMPDHSVIASILMDHIAVKCLNVISWSADISNRPQILKYRDIYNLDRKKDTMSIFHNVSTSTEAREVVILVENILLKLKTYRFDTAIPSPHMQFLLTPYDMITSKYLRMLELRFKCEYNFHKFGDLLPRVYLTNDYHKQTETVDDTELALSNWKSLSKGNRDYALALTLDSIFCLNEVIRTVNIYGINYITNHSYLANAHYKLANWCRAFENCMLFDFLEKKSRQKKLKRRVHRKSFEGKLVELLGTDAVYSLEPNYHDEKALQHLYAGIQTHNGGKAYRDNIMAMYFLEDDFNDNLTHFAAATERYRINTGVVRTKIIELKGRIAKSQVYKYSSYSKMSGKKTNLDIPLSGQFGFD